jgi:hypothetical protein
MENKPETISVDINSFRIINSNNIITTNNGDKWKQITLTGYLRLEDNFFWPVDPRNNNNTLNMFPPTIDNIKKERENYKLPYNKLKI